MPKIHGQLLVQPLTNSWQLRFLLRRADAELLLVLDECVPPLDLSRSLFRVAITKYEKAAEADRLMREEQNLSNAFDYHVHPKAATFLITMHVDIDQENQERLTCVRDQGLRQLWLRQLSRTQSGRSMMICPWSRSS